MIRNFNKLVRDRVPELLNNKDIKYRAHIADDEEFRQHLHLKLIEESLELNAERNVEEFADILEVVDAMKKYYGFSDDEIVRVKRNKKIEKGGFEKQLILEQTEE